MSDNDESISWEKAAAVNERDADYEAERVKTHVLYLGYFEQAKEVSALLTQAPYMPVPGTFYVGNPIIKPDSNHLHLLKWRLEHLSQRSSALMQQLEKLTAIEVERKLRAGP